MFDGITLNPIADFFGIDDSNFRGGAHAAVGDFVLVHAGYALTVVDADEAEETRRLFAEIEAAEPADEAEAARPDEAGDGRPARGGPAPSDA